MRPRMKRTSFRTFAFQAAFTPILVVGTAPTYRRVVLFNEGPGTAFVSSEPNELGIAVPAGSAPGGAFAIPARVIPNVTLVLSPHQKLYASANLAGSLLAVSASDVVGVETVSDRPSDTLVRTRQVPLINTNAAIEIATTEPRPRRVVVNMITLAPNLIFLSDQVNELNFGGPVPGGSFQLGSGFAVTFVLAPEQGLYAASSGPAAPVLASFSVSAITRRSDAGVPGTSE